MIFLDAKANEINIPNAKRVANLEAWSGSDLMISRLALPCLSRTLFQKHVDEGALLVQIKLGEDLAASVGERLNSSIARMRECTRRTGQHWLLFLGTLGCDHEGYAVINGKRTHMNVKWSAVDGAIVGWLARGGVYYHLSRESLLNEWVESMERRLGQYDAEQVKHVYNVQEYPDALPSIQDDPLQLPIRVRDGRVTLISLPGIGVELAERVWAYCGTLATSTHFLTDPASAGVVEGVGKAKIERIRAYFGLKDGEAMYMPNVDPIEDTVQRVRKELGAMSTEEREEKVAKDMGDLFVVKGKGKR